MLFQIQVTRFNEWKADIACFSMKGKGVNMVKTVAIALIVVSVLVIVFGIYSQSQETIISTVGPIDLTTKARQIGYISIFCGMQAIVIVAMLLVIQERKSRF